MLPGLQYTLIDDQSPTSGATVTIGASGSLPQTFDEIHIYLRNVRYAATGSGVVNIFFNNDTTLNNYWSQMLRAFGTTIAAASASGANIARTGGSDTLLQSNAIILIPGYTNASFGKLATCDYTQPGLTAFPATGNMLVGKRSVGHSGTAAITEIDLTLASSTWASGRILTYGVSYSRP